MKDNSEGVHFDVEVLDGDESVTRYDRVTLLFAVWFVVQMASMSLGFAQQENVGILRVADVRHPRQVSPSAQVAFVIDAEYAIRFNASIKSSLFAGTVGNPGAELWHSGPTIVRGGGDELWTFNLTAPPEEGSWPLAVFVYYQDGGVWKFYNDTYHGHGYAEITIKIAKLANLEIDLGVPNVPVTVNGATRETSKQGAVTLQLPVGQVYSIGVPSQLQPEGSARLVFLGWEDGGNNSLRALLLDGDSKIVGSYKTQYLLRVNSAVSAYSYSAWYDSGSNVTLHADSSVPASWPLGLLGLRYNFVGWSGDVGSTVNQINVTIGKPVVIDADFVLDYTTLVFPTIVGIGIVGGVALSILRRRSESKRAVVEEEVSHEEAVAKVCANCGEPVEEGWTHCVHCGDALGSPEPVKS